MENNYDSIKYINTLRKQMRDVVPEDLNTAEKIEYLEFRYHYHLQKFMEAIMSDDSIETIDDEREQYLIQLLAEYSFHKTVDILRSSIPNKYYNEILDMIFDIVIKTILQGIKENLTEDYMQFKSEVILRLAYQQIIKKYETKGLITQQDRESALKQDSIYQARIAEDPDDNYNYSVIFAKNKYFELGHKIPEDIRPKRDYILNTLIFFIYKCTEMLNYGRNINSKTYLFVCNELSNWIFIKTIDLVRLNLEAENIEFVLWQIGFTIYEIFRRKIEGDTLIQSELADYKDSYNIDEAKMAEIINYKVQFVFKSKLEELKESEIIDDNKINQALNVPLPMVSDTIEFNRNQTVLEYLRENESKYMKENILRAYTEHLTYKYLLKAGRLLKKNNYNWTDRHDILKPLKTAFTTLIWIIDTSEEVELDTVKLERLITVTAEITFQRIVVLHKLNITNPEFIETPLDRLVRGVFRIEIQAIKINARYYCMAIIEHALFKVFKEYFKHYVNNVNNPTITKYQYNHLLDKSKLVYLKPEIDKIETFRDFRISIIIIIVLSIIAIIIWCLIGVLYGK